MKALDDTTSVDPDKSKSLSWLDAEMTVVYHQRKLDALLISDPVMRVLEIRLLGQRTGPMSPRPRLRTVADAITALITLLREANMVVKRLEPDDIFTLEINRITTSLERLHKHLRILVGNTPTQTDISLAASSTQEAQKSQLTLRDIDTQPSAHVVTCDPRSREDLPRKAALPVRSPWQGCRNRGRHPRATPAECP